MEIQSTRADINIRYVKIRDGPCTSAFAFIRCVKFLSQIDTFCTAGKKKEKNEYPQASEKASVEKKKRLSAITCRRAGKRVRSNREANSH